MTWPTPIMPMMAPVTSRRVVAFSSTSTRLLSSFKMDGVQASFVLKDQLTYKFVNLFFLLVMVNNKLTNL